MIKTLAYMVSIYFSILLIILLVFLFKVEASITKHLPKPTRILDQVKKEAKQWPLP